MAETVRVTIGGREYSLVGEDSNLTRNAAEEVNKQIKELKKNYGDESSNTLSVLAALNIAEGSLRDRQQNDTDMKFANIELNKMAEFLKSTIDR